MRTLTVVGGCACLCIVLGQLVANRHAGIAQRAISESSAPRRLLDQTAELRKEKRALADFEKASQDGRVGYSPLVVLALLAEVKQQLDGMLEVQKLDFAEQAVPADGKSVNQHGRVTLTLTTSSVANSAKIIEHLRSTGRFVDVSMDSALEKLNSENGDLKFSVRCLF